MITERPLYPNVEVEAYTPYQVSHPAVQVYSYGFEDYATISHPANEAVYTEAFASGTGSWVAGTDQTLTQSTAVGTYRTASGSLAHYRSFGSGAGIRTSTRVVTGLVVGKSYTFSAWLKSNHASFYTWALGVTGISMTSYTASADTTNWYQRTYTFTATATSHELVLGLSATLYNAIAGYWDDITLTRADAWTEVTNNGLSGWTATGSVQSTVKRTGSDALQATSGAPTRTFTGLEPGRSYTLSAWRSTGSTFTQVSAQHTASSTSASWALPTSGAYYWDDVTLTKDAWTETLYEWTPLLADGTTLTIRRGGLRDGLGIKTDVGLCTFALKDAQDPLDGGVLKPGQTVRVRTGDYTPASWETVHSVDWESGSAGNTLVGGAVISTAQAHSGTHSLYGANVGGSTGVNPGASFTQVPGDTYRRTLWAYVPTGGATNVYFHVVGGPFFTHAVTLFNQWFQVTPPTWTAVDATEQVYYFGNGYVYFDDVRVERLHPEVDNRAPIFTGRISDFGSVYVMDKSTGESRAVVTVNVADAVKVHASTMRYGVDLGAATNETFEARIARLEDSANAPVEVPVVGAPKEVYSF